MFLRCAHFFPKLGCFFARAETDLGEFLRKLFGEKIEDFLRFGCAGCEFDTGVNVFGVLAKDHHVYLLRLLNRGGDTFEILNWPQTNEKIEELAKRDVQRPNTAADRSR